MAPAHLSAPEVTTTATVTTVILSAHAVNAASVLTAVETSLVHTASCVAITMSLLLLLTFEEST